MDGAGPLPLTGRRILVTRTREQGRRPCRQAACGGRVRRGGPLIATVPIAEPEAIVKIAVTIAAEPAPRWVAFTSATAVRLVIGAAGAPALSPMQVAAVGPRHRCCARRRGSTADLIAIDHEAAGLAAAMRERGIDGASVWIPVAAGASR